MTVTVDGNAGSTVGIIVGSGPLALDASLEIAAPSAGEFGPVSGPIYRGRVGANRIVMLSRHGEPHRIAPHLINYRANLQALKALGAECVIALNTVGGISPELIAGALAVPHDLVDYTWGRAQTFCDVEPLIHVDFTEPFDPRLRRMLADAGAACGLTIHSGGVYGCTQGPRFETPAEIDRLDRDGCTLVGMTGMPEAALAAELELPYASLCLVVNPAAGRGDGVIDPAAIAGIAASAMADVARLLQALLSEPVVLS